MKIIELCAYPISTVAAIFCIPIVIVSFSVKNQDVASLNHQYSNTAHQFKTTETNIMKTIHLCSQSNIRTSASSSIHKCLNSSVKIKRYLS
jgi:hypothetical protein